MPRGGKREGAGRPAQSLTDSKQNTPKGINDFKFNVIKEQIDLYKKLKKSNDPKALALMASLLKDIAPYLEKKMPTAPTTNDNVKPTVIEIIDVNGEDGGIV
tara:strand:+ start:464 stop:769 length:306 start_codon:yes stop_codon:yes gene_type:complete